MTMSKADVILHPVRMKIIQSLIKRSLTVQELQEWLPEIPQATLYRQLKVLTDSNVIYVSDERKVRGTFERTYSLNKEGVSISALDIAELSKDDHMKYFITFFANLMYGVEEYLEGDDINMAEDGFGYRQVDLFLDQEEFQQFKEDLGTIFNKYTFYEPSRTRRKRTLATVFIPEKKK